MMKLTPKTIETLKNFSTINAGIVLNAGKTQRTWSLDKSILVEAELDEEFPCQFGIYDLEKFLRNITVMDNPELNFTSEHVLLDDNTLKIKFRSCKPELISTPPNKELVLKNPDVSFVLKASILEKVFKLVAMNRFTNISVVGENGSLMFQGHDKHNDKSNTIYTEIDKWEKENFIFTFNAEHMKILPDEYEVKIKANSFSHFKSTTRNLSYFIALLTK